VASLIRKFAVPSILGLLVTAAYNIIDQIFIGNVVGMLGNAATNVAFPFAMLTTAFAQLVGAGTAANFNISQGAGKPGEAERFVGNGVTMGFFFGLLLMGAALTFKTPILLLCGATQNVLPYAEQYFGITALGIPFFLFTLAGSQMIRADGSPTYSMLCVVTGAVLNIFITWLFMFGFKWGIRGAASATVIGQGISFLMCVAYFPRFKSFPIKAAMLRVRPGYALRIAKLGTPNFINHVVLTAVNIVMLNSLAYYGALSVYGGDIALAVSGVIAKINGILISFCVGLAQGCQPILGFNMGAKNYARVKETYKKALVVTLTFSFLAFLALQSFPRQIVGIFGGGSELYFDFAERYMRIFLMMVFFFGVQPLTVNYFASIGYARQGTILSLSRQGFVLIPLLIFLPMAFGLDGILYAGPIADVLALALSLTLMVRNFRSLAVLRQGEL